jgi:hypothetical protein
MLWNERSWRRTLNITSRNRTVLVSATVLVLVFLVGCSHIDDVINGSLSRDGTFGDESNSGTQKQSPSKTGTARGPAANTRSETEQQEESSGPQPGTAEPAELPPAEAIEGCDESTCSVSDAVTYEHLYRGSVTIVLFADFSELEFGECNVVILSADGATTAQILPLEYVNAWAMTGNDLTNIFYFLDPATDATKNIFFNMPGSDGWSAAGLRPVSTGYFELVDLGYIAEDFSEIFDSQPMTGLSWGELDENGNYELEIEDAVARWDGQKYSAP